MIQGEIDVTREGQAGPAYRIRFLPYSTPERPAEHGAVRQQKIIQGLDLLHDFFVSKLLNQGISLERRAQMADEWTAKLQSEGHLSLRPVEISEELFDELTVR
jgi:hypothetical protein